MTLADDARSGSHFRRHFDDAMICALALSRREWARPSVQSRSAAPAAPAMRADDGSLCRADDAAGFITPRRHRGSPFDAPRDAAMPLEFPFPDKTPIIYA